MRSLSALALGQLLLALQFITGAFAIYTGDGFEVKYLDLQPTSGSEGRRLASSGRKMSEVDPQDYPPPPTPPPPPSPPPPWPPSPPPPPAPPPIVESDDVCGDEKCTGSEFSTCPQDCPFPEPGGWGADSEAPTSEMPCFGSNCHEDGECFNVFTERGLPHNWPILSSYSVNKDVYPPDSDFWEWRDNDPNKIIGTYNATVYLPEPAVVNGVGVVSDWWGKRPYNVMVYEIGDHHTLLSGRDFPTQEDQICGPEWNELCEYPEKPQSLLKVNLSEPKNLTGVYVEISGSISTSFGFVEKLLVY